MADKKLEITPEQARNLSLNSQLLFNSKLPKGKTGVLRAIEKLGYVQIDTINVIERSHHIVFFTRCPDYQKDYLHDLQAKDKKIFEYWAHAASFVPMKDYRFYLPTMKRKPKKDSRIALNAMCPNIKENMAISVYQFCGEMNLLDESTQKLIERITYYLSIIYTLKTRNWIMVTSLLPFLIH